MTSRKTRRGKSRRSRREYIAELLFVIYVMKCRGSSARIKKKIVLIKRASDHWDYHEKEKETFLV